jgi:hypothetical protein
MHERVQSHTDVLGRNAEQFRGLLGAESAATMRQKAVDYLRSAHHNSSCNVTFAVTLPE